MGDLRIKLSNIEQQNICIYQHHKMHWNHKTRQTKLDEVDWPKPKQNETNEKQKLFKNEKLQQIVDDDFIKIVKKKKYEL